MTGDRQPKVRDDPAAKVVASLALAVGTVAESNRLCVRLAGRSVELRATDPALLAALAPAIEHRRTPETSRPDLTVWIGDTASTGLDPQHLAAGWTPHQPRTGDGPRGPRTAFEPDGGRLTVLDVERATGYLWYPSVAAVPPWERAAPLRTLLHWWLPSHGTRLIHAAAVETGRRAALLVGPGGAGKSTTALACRERGLGYLGDDYVAVTSGEPRPTVHNLYASGKVIVCGQAVHLSPTDASPLAPIDERGKQAFRLDATGLPDQAEAVVILVMRLGAGQPGIHPIGRADALRAVAPSTVLQQPGDQQAALSFLRRLVATVPVRAVNLHPDPAIVAGHVAAAIEEGDQ